ncbi:MFS transporter [Nocardia miyunensis]|uniref:MFS transporter n=1 Tax=Nocardia miyunensis TaxID=282684 RepID=UPI0008368B06|nr:MFS transporter [Nocardia miyunensis]
MNTTNSPGKVVLASFIGSVVEWYDFNIYGLAAALVFREQFFPSFSQVGGTLAALATFAVGFVARPLGALVMGHFGDRVGRKKMLVVSLLTMGTATTAIGFLPTFATIGVWAPILLVALRLLQGVGVGGEWGGAVLIAVEHAPPNRRALFGVFPQIGIPSGALLSQAVFLVIAAVLPAEALHSWGWRIPFLLSSVLIVIGLVVRKSITETAEFDQAQQARKIARVPFVELLRGSPRQVVAGSLLSFAGPTLGTFISVYMVSYGTHRLGMAAGTMLWISVSISVPWIAFMLIGGRISDRFGCRPIYLTGAGLAIVLVLPMFALVNTAVVPLVALGLLLIAVANSLINGAQPAMLARMFPAGVRYSGSSLCYQIGSIVGGGLVPLLAESLYARFGTSIAVAVLIGGVCAVSLLAVASARNTVLGADASEPTVPATRSEAGIPGVVGAAE